ncbi:DnaJ protein,putative [Plasmodium gaboni]|uniref:DnaJ protein,putative n=1 Tax=Plasmodium gaboni TaxID=647221 RepID=A0ABY0KWW2_9APIC|nr:DnaJ protein,putative [Plasmodium gaboni]
MRNFSKSSGNYNERLFEINNLSNTQNNGIIYDKESNDLFRKRENYFGNFNNDDISKRSIKYKRDVRSKESNISKNVGECKFAGRTNKVIESDVSSRMMLSLETINTNINETTLKIHHIGKNLVMKTNIKKMIMEKKKKKKNDFDKRKRKKTKVSSPDNKFENPDTTYYDILHVTPDTYSNEIIKNNYYKLALEYHPDKNTRNDEPKMKFEKISEAYQILSDKEKREKYNKEGLDENMIYTTIINFVTDQFTRGNIFETLVVGKSSFEKYGDLIKKMEEKEKEKINKLVLFLKYRLQKYIDGDEDTWIVIMENILGDLLESKFSCYIIESVGWIYENVSKGYIGKEAKIISLDEKKKARKQAKHRDQMNRKEAIIWSFRTVSSIGYILSGEPKNHLMIHGVTCNMHNNNERYNVCNDDDNSSCSREGFLYDENEDIKLRFKKSKTNEEIGYFNAKTCKKEK